MSESSPPVAAPELREMLEYVRALAQKNALQVRVMERIESVALAKHYAETEVMYRAIAERLEEGERLREENRQFRSFLASPRTPADAPHEAMMRELDELAFASIQVARMRLDEGERERERLEGLLGEQMGELHIRDGKDIHSRTWLPGDKRALSPRQRAILGLSATLATTTPEKP